MPTEIEEIFLELIIVGKWSHFPKEVIMVNSVATFRWKLEISENVVLIFLDPESSPAASEFITVSPSFILTLL